MALQYVSQTDPAVADAMRQELTRERDSVELIASENFTSPAVMEAVGSVLTNKYAEGYPRKRYYGGCEKVDLVEDLARERACQLFGSNFANVQPHCGANANLGAYEALIELGDTVGKAGVESVYDNLLAGDHVALGRRAGSCRIDAVPRHGGSARRAAKGRR